MTERQFADFAAEDKLSRRSLVGRATFFGAAMAAIGDVAQGPLWSYSDAAIALPDSSVAAKTREEQIRAVRIARAMRAGPRAITENATVAEMDKSGRMTDILRKGANEWVCMPGNEDQRGCRRRSAHVCRRLGHAMVQGSARREATADQRGARALLHALRRDATQQHGRPRQDEPRHPDWPALDDPLALRR
jgi:hypothetical protein